MENLETTQFAGSSPAMHTNFDSVLRSDLGNEPVPDTALTQKTAETEPEQEPLTKAKDGQRPEVSPKYHYNRSIMLRGFAGAFPNTAVCELGKSHLDQFMRGLGEMRNKSRNHMRAVSVKVRSFSDLMSVTKLAQRCKTPKG